MSIPVYILIVAIVIIVIRSIRFKSKAPLPVTVPVPETEEQQIRIKIANLKKKAKDGKVYEKSLEILSFFNNRFVRTYYIYPDDDLSTESENEKMEKAGIIRYKTNSLIIEKEGMELSIINEGKTVFAWRGKINANTGNYIGSEVYSYIPGSWEQDIDQLFIKIQEENKILKELTKKQDEEQEKRRWGL